VKINKLSSTTVALILAICPVIIANSVRADQFRNNQWHLRALQISAANKISKGQGVIVAVADTGVYPHPDLRDNLLIGKSIVGVSNDKGRVDPNGHGTLMASLIAAHGRGSSGVVGVAPSAKVLPIRVSDAEGRGGSSGLAEAIEWATDNGARVINVSGAVAPSIALNSAIAIADRQDVLVVAAAGNRGQDVISAYPASMQGVLAVGASDKSGKHASISIPSKHIQICAPGVAIQGATPKDRYSIGQGTSEATAVVSGAAALVRAKFPELSAQQVIQRLTNTATDIGSPGRDDECGFGVLNVVKALTAPLDDSTASAPPSSAAPTPHSAPATASTADASPETEPAATNLPAIAVGLAAVLAVAGLLGFLVIRRRGR
jgi:type VII secretion-associated serine protease mycosin